MDHITDISNTLMEETDISNNCIIKHIVISGGGHYGLTMYGILKESHKKDFWKYENIETLYGTSIGSVLCLLITLQYEWETLDKYFIDRPWNKVFDFDFHTIIEAFENQGIFNQNTMNQLIEPLFLGKDIPLDITLKEYYERTHIDFHITTSEVVSFKLNVLSHKTHPEWKLLDAIYASCTIPIIFKPIITDDSCYIDGGLFSSYPSSSTPRKSTKRLDRERVCSREYRIFAVKNASPRWSQYGSHKRRNSQRTQDIGTKNSKRVRSD